MGTQRDGSTIYNEGSFTCKRAMRTAFTGLLPTRKILYSIHFFKFFFLGQLIPLLSYAAGDVSAVVVVIITIVRFRAIWWEIKASKRTHTPRKSAIITFTIWFLVLLTGIPDVFSSMPQHCLKKTDISNESARALIDIFLGIRQIIIIFLPM